MAYLDENGKISIDELETAEDINRLKAYLESLSTISTYINGIKDRSSAMSGKAATELTELATTMGADVDILVQGTEDTINYINKIVEKYKEIDASLKKTIIAYN